MLQEALQNYHQMEQKAPLEPPSEGLYSLKIRNTTSCSSGTYKCTLEGPGGQRNQSGIVILRVTGEGSAALAFFLQNAHALSVGPKVDRLPWSVSQKLGITSVPES